ncbi:MAG: transposase [Rhodospirillales bacterium]|nr:transposase [Acetobacter sp.]
MLNGVLWILRSGARWKDLSARLPPYQTCHRRFQGWVCSGALRDMLEALDINPCILLHAGPLYKGSFWQPRLGAGHGRCLNLRRANCGYSRSEGHLHIEQRRETGAVGSLEPARRHQSCEDQGLP